MDATKTGTFIAGLRKERGLTQRELAQALHVSDKAVSRWETGAGMPDLDNLEGLSQALGTSVAELLHGERIQEPVEPATANDLATSGLDLARQLVRRRSVGNVILGILGALVIAVLVAVHLTSPIALPHHEGIAQVERANNGTYLVAIFDDAVAGYDTDVATDPDTGARAVFLSCYTTRLFQLTGRDEFGRQAGLHNTAGLGGTDEVDRVYYYPNAAGNDVLLYTNEKPASMGVVTLPRLVYNMWLTVGLVASVVGLIAYVLLRKRWYGERVLKVALVPACFTTSLVAVLWGHFGEVYNAAFYLSGIVLLAIALYALVLFALSRVTRLQAEKDDASATPEE